MTMRMARLIWRFISVVSLSSDVDAHAGLGEARAERPVVHAEVRAAEDRLRPWIGVRVAGVQEIEHVKEQLQAGSVRHPHSLRRTYVPGRPRGLMIGEPRQQLTADCRSIRMQAVVHNTIAIDIGGTVDRERKT